MNSARKLVENLAMGGHEQNPRNAFGDEVHPGAENDLGDELDNGDASPEEQFADELQDLLDEVGARCQTFSDAGVMTDNVGLVVRHPKLGKFQITIVEDY